MQINIVMKKQTKSKSKLNILMKNQTKKRAKKRKKQTKKNRKTKQTNKEKNGITFFCKLYHLTMTALIMQGRPLRVN